MTNIDQMNYGYMAFKTGDFNTAISFLSRLDNSCPSFWEGKLYLAMSYWQIGKVSYAIHELTDISEWCPSSNLKDKAKLALRELTRTNH